MEGRINRLSILAVLTALLFSCARSVEPGLYEVGEGFVRVYVDSLGHERALLYKDLDSLWADTLSIDLKAQKWDLKPYVAPEFHRFPERVMYRDPAYRVRDAKDIVYGRVLRGDDEHGERMDLTMDVYVPLDGGSVARPLMVALHGGAFMDGDKRDSSLVEWCRHFASLGYVVASPDYRQGYRRNEKATDEAMFTALKDASAAIRFLKKRDSLLVHSERIFVAGFDAGAITALNLAYMREENMPEIIEEKGDSTVVTREVLRRGFDVRAVANLWGAVPDSAILHNDQVPVISFQSRKDTIVPFGIGHPFEGPVEVEVVEEPEEPEESTSGWEGVKETVRSVIEVIQEAIKKRQEPKEEEIVERHLFREMYGAEVIHRILSGRGVSNELHAFDGDRHVPFLREDGSVDFPIYDEIKEQTASFFASKMVVSPVNLRQDPEDPTSFIIDNTEVVTCLWQVEGGVLLGKGDDAIRVLFFPDAPVHAVSVSGEYASGWTFNETVRLELDYEGKDKN